MSEKFVVGQWVTWHERAYRVEQIDEAACGLRLNSGAVGAVSMWIPSYECFPFVWQLATYRTTLDGVTATIQAKTNKALYGQDSRPDSLSEEWAWDDRTGLLRGIEKVETAPHLLPYLADQPPPESDAAGIGHDIKTLIFESLGEASMCWSETPRGIFDSDKAVEVGERLVKALRSKLFPLPTIPIADEDAATFSEFADADGCEEPDALQSLLTEFSHRREQCQRMAESWETKAAEWRRAEQMIVKAIERAKR